MDTTALAERLAQEIRRVDGSHSLGAAALADALVPFVESLRAVAGEPVAASGKAAAWECRAMLRGGTRSEWHKCSREQYDSIRLTGHYNGPGGAPCECRALYLHPATVTDEDVERACDASWPTARFSAESMTNWAHADPLRRDHHKRVVRAALESFANKEPTDE